MNSVEYVKSINKTDLIGVERIMIVGLYATGKTSLTNLLSQAMDLPVYHTDQYLKRLDRLEFIMNRHDRWIIEGAAGYSMLFNIRQHPQVVVNCICSDGTRQRRYLSPERMNGKRYDGDKPGFKAGFKQWDKYYRELWDEYKTLRCPATTKIFEYLTEPI